MNQLDTTSFAEESKKIKLDGTKALNTWGKGVFAIVTDQTSVHGHRLVLSYFIVGDGIVCEDTPELHGYLEECAAKIVGDMIEVSPDAVLLYREVFKTDYTFKLHKDFPKWPHPPLSMMNSSVFESWKSSMVSKIYAQIPIFYNPPQYVMESSKKRQGIGSVLSDISDLKCECSS